jgi:hypothetical protein
MSDTGYYMYPKSIKTNTNITGGVINHKALQNLLDTFPLTVSKTRLGMGEEGGGGPNHGGHTHTRRITF